MFQAKVGFGIQLVSLFLISLPVRAGPADDLRDLLGGGRSGKLVARDKADNDKIYVFDLDNGDLYPLSSEIACREPLISPDGTRVSYSRGKQVLYRAIDGTGDANLVADGYNGHFWIEPGTGDEWIYYTTLGNDPNDTRRKCWWPDNQGITTRRIRLRDGQDEAVVDWKASAGPSLDGTHVGGAYATVLILETASGTEHVVNGGNQGCNGSMSPDNRYFVMHLELPHDTFCYRDMDDNRLWYVQKPDGTTEWQNPEWSSDVDFATATAEESNGNYSVYAVQISNKTKLRVLDARSNGRDWAEPYLWVEAAPVPVLSLNKTSISFTAIEQESASGPETVAVTNAGDGTLDEVATDIEYDKGSDWLTVVRDGQGNSQSLTNAVDITGLSPGTYSAQVEVTATRAESITYRVTLTVTESGQKTEPAKGEANNIYGSLSGGCSVGGAEPALIPLLLPILFLLRRRSR